MQRFLFLISMALQASLATTQSLNQQILDELGKLRSVTHQLRKFEQLGIKEDQTQALMQTADWISDQLTSYGIAAHFDTFIHPSGHPHRNVVAQLEGTSEELLLLGAHYDTKNGPGVNDNGSGVAVLLETARVLSALQPHLTLRMVFFSAEEDGFWGSKHDARVLDDAGAVLRLMLNLDQLGGHSAESSEKRIYCERDEGNSVAENDLASSRYTDTLARIFSLYTHLTPVISKAYSSDYMSYEAEGHTITGLYQYAGYPFTHTINDSLSRIDTGYLNEVLRGVLAAALHFSGTPKFINLRTEVEALQHFYVQNGRLYWVSPENTVPTGCRILDMHGRVVLRPTQDQGISLYGLLPGYYWAEIEYAHTTLRGRFLLHSPP